ncbi:MAG TPA: tyrosine-type recombinase/integrase, partial [Desulfatiglandales bacterium]|nr:tyrosine-type recombinase/integrase [Desulfatiglandales bacterium]
MLTKRGRFYHADIYINGKRIRRSLKTAEKLVALDRLRVLQDKLLATSQSKDIRLEDFCKQYMEWAWSEKPASALHEKYRIKKIEAFFKNLNIEFLGDITPFHIEQFKAWLKNQKKPKLAKSTINLYLQQVRGMFYRAIDWEVYSGTNPMKKVRSYKTSPVVTILTDAQVGNILKASKLISDDPKTPIQVEWYDMVLLAINTGMRKGEVLNLKWKDVKDDEIVVRGKGEKTRIIPLNDLVL